MGKFEPNSSFMHDMGKSRKFGEWLKTCWVSILMLIKRVARKGGQHDDILSLLIHLGYLGYDDETSEVFIPNKEILDEYKTSTKTKEWTETFQTTVLTSNGIPVS